MSRHNRNLSYYHNPDTSFDPFSSPQQPSRNNNYQSVPQSVDLFERTPKRRSTGEPDSIGRAIRNALDPEYWNAQQSVDVFGPSTSTVNYDDDASILAAVSSAHSSQEMVSQPSSSSTITQKPKRKENPKPRPDHEYAAIFNHPSKNRGNENPLMDDFLSPEGISRYRNQQRRQRPKQVRMDDYLFKARRVDKGAREFGLHTTHEPKRGSKKKRDSIEVLEVERAEFEKMRQKKRETVVEKRKADVDQLDFSLAFGTPSPVRSQKPKTSKLTRFFEKDTQHSSAYESSPFSSPKRSITANDPSIYSSDSVLQDTISSTPKKLHYPPMISTPSPARNQKLKASKLTKFFEKDVSKSLAFQSPKRSIATNDPNKSSSETVLDETVCSTPNKSMLPETVPLFTPSPAKTPKRTIPMSRPSGKPIIGLVKPNPIKRRDHNSFDKDRQPLVQAKRQRCLSSSRKPEFDYPSSPIILTDDEDSNIKKEQPIRETLQAEEQQRKKFGRHVSEREQMMKNLVDQKFKEERENGGVERRRAELKDGEVIRNKEMRKNLMHGASCKCCRGYYEGLDMEEQEKKEYMDKVSRHRYVHQPLPDTPERYWDLTLGPRDEEDVEPEMTQNRKWESVAKKKEERGIHKWN